MGWIELAIAVFQLIFRVWDTVKEVNAEKKAQKQEILKNGIQAIVNKDATGITLAFDQFKRV